MNMNNENEKKIDGAAPEETEKGEETVDLFALAAETQSSAKEDEVDLFELAVNQGEPLYTPAPEDIFVIGDASEETEDEAAVYPGGFEEFAQEDDSNEEYEEDSDEDEEDLDEDDSDEDEEDSDEEDSDEDDEEDSDEDDSDEDDEEDFDEDDSDEDEEEDSDEEDSDEDEEEDSDEEDSDEDEEDFDEEDSDEDEEDFDEDDSDEDDEDFDEEDSDEDDEEEYDEDSDEDDEEEFDEDSDEDDEEYDEDDSDEDDEEDSDEEYEEYKEYDYSLIPGGFTDCPDEESGEEAVHVYDEEFDDEYPEEPGEGEEAAEDEDGGSCPVGYFDAGELPESASGDAGEEKTEEAPEEAQQDGNAAQEDASVDLFALAGHPDDLPRNETHGALYYWAKRKTVGGWVKFGLKCVAAVLLIAVVAGALYFNGLLNLIDYKAADDFEIYDSISESDYEDEEEIVYSSPESYIETTTIEGFTESMIDIPKKDVLNILLIGTDVRGGTYDERGNTDSMILISVNTRDKNIKLTSFMRDMYVFIPNRQWARLNVAYAYGGPQLLFDTLKQNFNVDVDLYVRVNFMYFRKIVNHVGGVDIELSEAEAKYMNDTSEKYKTKPVEPGWQHLDGAQALSYARCRKIDSDFNRTKRQRTVILALVDKIKHSSPGELNSLLNVFLPMIQTNMSKMQILGLMVDATTYLNNEIETLNVPIKNSWRSEMINKRSVICPNFELNKTAIVAHIYSTYHLDVEKTKYQRFEVPKS